MRPVFLFLLLIASAGAARAEEGRWIAGLDVVPSNVTCMRTYRCAPDRKVTLAPDETIVSTPSQRVAGVCARGIGPLTACTQCLTSPPKERCTWRLYDSHISKSDSFPMAYERPIFGSARCVQSRSKRLR